MKTHLAPLDIEADAGHHDLRRYRAEHRGGARRRTKQALSHLSHTVARSWSFAGEDDPEILQFSGALPANTTVE